MKAFEMGDVLKQLEEYGGAWLEFLRVPDLITGIYHLKAGEKDWQQPHSEDEVYFVLKGQGLLHVEGDDTAVQPGSLVYVAAHAKHYFHAITEDLDILVFFAPAEGSQKQG